LEIFDEKIEIGDRCKGVHCVDLGESFPTRIYLQKSASIQPRTSPSKFGVKIQFNIQSCPYPRPAESPQKGPGSPSPKVVFQPQVPKKSSPSQFLGQWAGNKFPSGASVQVAGICGDGEDFTSERTVLAREADENGEFVEIFDTSWATKIFDGLPFKMALRCSKGKKNFTASPAPNQDNYSITKFFSGLVVTAICDGHGPFGHWVSFRLAQTLPYYLARDAPPALPCDASGKTKIDEAFTAAQEDVLNWCEQLRVDLSCSGSTVTVVLIQDKLGHAAWCGDSPVLTVDGGGEVNITPSHNPNDPEELKRIEDAGGDVNVQKQPPRIYRPGSHLPGLCVSRALGDAGMSDIGVPQLLEASI
jgi:serine/threonine protein phosphatase PrpC